MTLTARLLAALVLILPASALTAQNWIAPTPAELSMTAQPEVPGAAAVYLNREEIADDNLHVFTYYARVKILTDAGKEYANVEVRYIVGSARQEVTEAAGRTIHPDGTIVPFTGKPYQKLVAKGGDYKFMETIFSLPSVEVGSIVEYRYKLRYDDNYFRSPDWYIQSDLYTRNAHYHWTPTSKELLSNLDGGSATTSFAWTPLLPPGAEIKQTFSQAPTHPGSDEHDRLIDLTVHDIPPTPHEEFMPPLDSISYRVHFYYTSFRSPAEYWKAAGKRWSKEQDRFIGPGSGVKDAVAQMVTPTDTADQKLRKFYAAVMALDNTDYTRSHSTREDKSEGFREVKTADDILARKRGSSDQLAELFIAMARAAGIKAYAMGVADRNRRIFLPSYLETGQLDDIIAIVNVDGKDEFLDPGTRYCAYGHLPWQHAQVSGLRQTDGGTAIANVYGEGYTNSHVTRVGDLTMDETGKVHGTLTFTYSGDPALSWRHRALEGDETSLKKELHDSVESMFSASMDINVVSVAHIAEYDVPLVVKYEIDGGVGTPAGKRLLIPAALFEANSKPHFSQEKRDLAVDMHYGYFYQDAVRIKLPPTLAIESLPDTSDASYPKVAAYKLTVSKDDNSYTIKRDLVLGHSLFLPADYPDLRGFYNKVQTLDQTSVVLTRARPSAASSSSLTIEKNALEIQSVTSLIREMSAGTTGLTAIARSHERWLSNLGGNS